MEVFLKNFAENNVSIDKMLLRGLYNIPKNMIDDRTKILLPDLYYSKNMRCNVGNTRLFDENVGRCMKEGVIFLNNGVCIICEYLPDDDGHFTPLLITDKKDMRYIEKESHFDKLWNQSY